MIKRVRSRDWCFKSESKPECRVEETLCCGIQFVIYISMAVGEAVGSQSGLPSV